MRGSDQRGARGGDPALSRRQLLVQAGQLGGLVLAGGALAGCGGNGGGGSSTNAAAGGRPVGAGERIAGIPGPPAYRGGRRGGTIVVAWDEGPNSLDPAVGYNPTAWDALTQLVYAPLFGFGGQTGGPVPHAAAEMPEVTDGGRTLVISLRPGVTFHSGREVTAADYKWSWERLLNPETASWAQSYLSAIAGADDVVKGRTRELRGVEAVDGRTLRIRLTRPDFTIVNALASPYTAPVPREAVVRLGKRFGREPVGSGPFKVESYDDAAQRARFVRNPDYFWPDLPLVDAVEYRWGVSSETQLQQLKAGDVSALGLGVPASLVPVARADRSLRDSTFVIPQLAVRYIALNLEKAPFSDRRVRQALNWAIDRKQLEKISYGESVAWGAPFPPKIEGFRRVARPYGYDPARAKRLLADAGYGSGFSVSLHISGEDPGPKIAQVVQSQLAKVGVRVRIRQVGGNALNDLLSRNAVDMGLTHWYLVQPTPGDILNAVYVTEASDNNNGYSNRQVDELARRAQATFDPAEQNANYAQIEKLLTEDAPAVFLASFNYVAGRSPTVQNFQYRGEYGIYYDRLWLTA